MITASMIIEWSELVRIYNTTCTVLLYLQNWKFRIAVMNKMNDWNFDLLEISDIYFINSTLVTFVMFSSSIKWIFVFLGYRCSRERPLNTWSPYWRSRPFIQTGVMPGNPQVSIDWRHIVRYKPIPITCSTYT